MLLGLMGIVGGIHAASISGIAISQYSTRQDLSNAANRISWGWNAGQILRFDVRNGQVDAPVTLYEAHDAHCPRISPSGTRVVFNTNTYRGSWSNGRPPTPDADCRGSIYVMTIEGEGMRELVSDVNCLIWLDWPMEDYVYYQSDYEGSKLWRVNTKGTPQPELLASNFRGKDESAPDGARYWSVASDGIHVGGWFGGSLHHGTIGNGSVTFRKLWGGCGGSLSPDGNVLTRNGGSHDSIYYHSPDNDLLDANLQPFSGSKKDAPAALAVSDCSGNGEHWHRMHWPVNSSEWLLISMGNGYQIDEGCHPVLLKRDGSECFSITPLRDDEYYEGSDFWFGNPGDALNATRNGTPQMSEGAVKSGRLHFSQANSRLFVSLDRMSTGTVRLLRPNGEIVAETTLRGRKSAMMPINGFHGVYLVNVKTTKMNTTERLILR